MRLAFGSDALSHPCDSHPPPASLRVAPASRKRLGDFLPDQPRLHLLYCLNGKEGQKITHL
ncbi:hypothetical protein A8A57_21920 [Lelliottia amnigena]|nr:hypothetical protein A8A57_21920 [Lelliottia amnigena]